MANEVVDLAFIAKQLERVLAEQAEQVSELRRINLRLAVMEGRLAGMEHRFAAIESRLIHLQTFGTWLLAGLLGSYAAIFAVAAWAVH
jgi:hypothetical protein